MSVDVSGRLTGTTQCWPQSTRYIEQQQQQQHCHRSDDENDSEEDHDVPKQKANCHPEIFCSSKRTEKAALHAPCPTSPDKVSAGFVSAPF